MAALQQEVSSGQPHIQREVRLAHRNFSTHGSFAVYLKPLVSVADTAAGHARTLGTALQDIFKYDHLGEPSKDVIRMRHVNMFDEEPLLNDIIQLTGFSKLSSLRSFNIDPCLIIALVERWRPETHNFHLPHGECTITLEDVSLQLGVNVNGLPIAEPIYFDWNEICEELLGKVPGDEQDMRGCELKLTWLFDNFETLPLALHSCKKSNFVGHESYT
ncbi:hypothetical protein Lal_00026911 [Lupinus albus]|nr:hypothetical protein Lal_00026911 [Lupinus albus]